jgi:threonine synthase
VATPTIADGVAIANPPLIDAMWAAVRKTNGRVITIPEPEIARAQAELAHRGF